MLHHQQKQQHSSATDDRICQEKQRSRRSRTARKHQPHRIPDFISDTFSREYQWNSINEINVSRALTNSFRLCLFRMRRCRPWRLISSNPRAASIATSADHISLQAHPCRLQDRPKGSSPDSKDSKRTGASSRWDCRRICGTCQRPCKRPCPRLVASIFKPFLNAVRLELHQVLADGQIKAAPKLKHLLLRARRECMPLPKALSALFRLFLSR